MEGVGPPLVTPFTKDGEIEYEKLRNLVNWVEERGVDFLVPCGSNSEAELMTADERSRVIETVADKASVPVIAGTGHPGLQETLAATAAASEAGAEAALVVTPFYYSHDQVSLEAYYREVADESPLPIYLYSVPAYTGIRLKPETVGRLASHPNIVGMKDSHASISEFIRTMQRVQHEEFDLMIGSASVLAQALDVGATGGVVALANVAPEATAEVYETHQENPAQARSLNAELVELNTAVTTKYSIPGLKWAMRARDAPAGSLRSPHRQPDSEARQQLQSLISDL